MPDTQSTIRYVIDVDTTAGTAAIKKMVEDGMEGGTDAGGQPKKPRKKPDPAEEADATFDILKFLGPRLRSGALGAILGGAVSGGGGAVIGGAGGLIGGKVGAVVTSAGLIIDQLVNVGRSLALFNGQLFQATTQMDFFMMGWKIEFAQGVSESLAELMDALQGFLTLIMPLLIATFNTLTFAANLVIDAFNLVAGAAVRVYDFFDSLTFGLLGLTFEALGATVKTLGDWLGFAADAAADLTDAQRNQLMGHQIATALFSSLEQFGAGAGHGPQSVAEQGTFRPDLAPMPPARVSANTPAASHAAGQRELTGGSFPRPTPAAVNFRMADTIQIQAHDQFNIEQEILGLRNDVMAMLRNLHDSRWLRIASARLQLRNADPILMGGVGA